MADVQSCPRPAQEGTNLLDLFAKVPALLETCRHAWPLQAAGIIRALRLVSKDMGPIVMRTAQSCGVQVGEGAWPNPSEVVRLMSHAVLRSMDVTILIRSDNMGFSADQQLDNCMRQTEQLIAGMGLAIHKLTHLHVTVTNVSSTKPKSSMHLFNNSIWDEAEDNDNHPISLSSDKIYNKVLCPEHLVPVPAIVFKLLASAVPRLQHMSLSGCCRDANLAIFGALCPNLHSLRVEAAYVRCEALRDLQTCIPQLTHFILWQRGVPDRVLHHALPACFAALSSCTSLTTLVLDFGEDSQISFKQAAWDMLPASILELQCTCHIWSIEGAASLFKHLERLVLLQHPIDNLLKLLDFAPNLQMLSVQRDYHVPLDGASLYDREGSPTTALLLLRQRLPGMHFSFPALALIASVKVFVEILSLFPAVPSILSFHGLLDTSLCGDFLLSLPRTFPNLANVELSCLDTSINGQPVNEECLLPLLKNRSLTKMVLDVPISHTTVGLLRLCMGLPLLTVVKCRPSTGLDHEELLWRLYDVMPNLCLTLLGGSDDSSVGDE